MNRALSNEKERRIFPPLGQRIIKTTVAVFICLVIYYLRGYEGDRMSTEAMITAIIVMQPYVKDSRDYALNRFAGTLIGAFWGLMFLLMLLVFPSMASNRVLLYARMALGVLVSLYSAVLIRKSDAAALAAIVFLCIVVAFPDVVDPLRQTGERILDVFIGTTVAIGVNVLRLPREKRRERVFFVRISDLVPDRFSQISSAALYRLNYLYDDGAKICLMSEHAPAFFMVQMSAAKVNVPLIVMDGAAIYDAVENTYLHVETIPEEDSRRLRERLAELKLSVFIYTVHNNRTCVFHRGEMSAEEQAVYDRMRRSPYRSYLEGESYDYSEIVYFKIIAPQEKIVEIEYTLRRSMPRGKLRAVIRPQAGSPGVSALYIYSHAASMEQAKKKLIERQREYMPKLETVEIRLRGGCRSERDTMQLLHAIGSSYEPVSFRRAAFARKEKAPSERERR
ncbi:MAG: FUSC family protein [Oscillospiraceae bacterium]|nr:FUSC family protein [Oscillospiraceae bacterium]